MKWYYEGTIGGISGETEKAICLTKATSAWGRHDTRVWVPKSIIIMGEPNENGWRRVAIPAWFLRQNRVQDLNQFRECNSYFGMVQY